MYCSTRYDSPLGELTLCAREDRLVGVWIQGQAYFGGTVAGKMEPGDSAVLARTRDWLDQYFAGERPDPACLPLDPAGSPFRQAVWQCLLRIPYGQVITYGQLAEQAAAQLGRTSASARAAGGAAGHNPISIIIPCHRVVGARGSLTGYAGGTDKKLWLLRHEGVDPEGWIGHGPQQAKMTGAP